MSNYTAKIFLSEKQLLSNAQKKVTESTENSAELTALLMP